MNVPPRDLPRTLLQLLLVGGLFAGSFWILRPFLGPAIWAATIVIATWPLVLRLRAVFRGRRAPVAIILVTALLLVLVVPLAIGTVTFVTNIDTIVEQTKALADLRPSVPPDWVERLPVVGKSIAEHWRRLAAEDLKSWSARLAPYATALLRWIATRVGGLGVVILQFFLTTMIAGILWTNGDRWAAFLIRGARRLAGEQGEATLTLAAQAVRGVALGIVVTAAVQSMLGGLGLAIMGVPYVTLLVALMLFLAVAQIGVWPVLVVAAAWLYRGGETGQATFMVVWTIVVGFLDNFLRPILIRRGADLPLLLVFAGVLGGLVAFGVIGLFVGPVILAVCYKLLAAWIDEGEPVPPPLGEVEGPR